jgi:hypothetical protein
MRICAASFQVVFPKNKKDRHFHDFLSSIEFIKDCLTFLEKAKLLKGSQILVNLTQLGSLINSSYEKPVI